MEIEETTNDAVEAVKVEHVVANWGEGFRKLANHPRLTFEGDAVLVKLWRPIKVGGAEVSELSIREPSMNEMKKIDGIGGGMAIAQRMIVTCAGITEREAGEVGLRDLTTISAIVTGFTAAVPATGSSFSAN